MIIQQSIEKKLSDAFDPEFLLVENESHMHSGTAPETHFKVTLASDAFEGVRKVARHQKVYGLLQEELAGPVHALALHLYSPDEWAVREGSPDSPDCLGGSKSDK
jgi:BolA protein